MGKLPELDHVKYVRSKGRVYAYFNTGQKRNGKTIYAPMGSPSSPGFLDRWVTLKGVRTKRQSTAYSIAAFVDDFLISAEYNGKAIATQRLYKIQLGKLTAILGDDPAARLEAEHVRTILENENWKAGSQNAFVAAIGALYKWGRTRKGMTVEPVRGFGKAEGGSHDPWPDEVLEAALKAENDTVRLATNLLYFTGLRIGDACRLCWNAIKSDFLIVTPEKTKRFRKTLEIHISSELRAELDRTPKKGLTILTSATGGKARVHTVREELQAFTRALGVETVPHGLRKNAVNALLEASCSVAEVAAITGQTHQMVEHYAARINTRKMGQAAILKLDKARGTKAV